MKPFQLEEKDVTKHGASTAIFLCIITSIALNLPYSGYSPVLSQIMVDLGLNYTQGASLASVTAFVSGFVVLISGVLVDKWSPAKSIMLALGVLAIGELIFALSPNYGVMITSRVVVGLGVTLVYAGSMAIAVRWLDGSKHKGFGVGALLASDGYGAIASLYLFSFVMIYFGWRVGNIIGTVIVFLVFLACLFWLRDHPSFNIEKRALKRNPDDAPKENYFKIVFRRNVMIPACYIIGYIGGYSVALYWVPTLLVEQGWSESTAGLIAALYPLAGSVGAMLSGSVSDRLGRKKPMFLLAGTMVSICFFFAALAVQTNHYLLLALTLPLAGFASYIGSPMAYLFAADEVGTRNVGTANGFILGCGFLIGGSLFPLFVGIFKDMTNSYTVGFVVTAALVTLVSLVIPLFVKENVKKTTS